MAIKNLDPKEVSEMAKGAVRYSKPCRAEKMTPKRTVIFNEIMAFLNFPLSIS